ncbi:MAG: hypothetical protein NVS1B14_10030 [Vulcanimicrobiaceae bacterium]
MRRPGTCKRFVHLGLVYAVFAICGGGWSLAEGAGAAPIPKALAISTVDNVAGSHPLAHVRSFEYVIQNQTENGRIARLSAGGADMVVIDVPSSLAENGAYNDAVDVAMIKASLGESGHHKIVLAYVDIGEAEDYRRYWQTAWKWNDHASLRTTPEWILGKDPDGWPGNYPVAFWKSQWQDIMYNKPGSVLDRVLAAGYDGIYMDWVEAGSFQPVIDRARVDRVNPDQAMIAYISAIKKKARATNPKFLTIAQNATGLRSYPQYMRLLDGQGQEQVFFDGTATGGSNADPAQGDCALPLHHGAPPPASNPGYCQGLSTLEGSSEDYVRALGDYLQAGIPVFTIDYALDSQHAAFVYAQDRWFNFVGLVTMRSLGDLTATPPSMFP